MTDELRRSLASLIEQAKRIVAFTGAGISTECGVPDFRSKDSPWRRYPPLGFQDFLSDPAVRVEAWRRKFAMDDLYAGARPGRTHRAIARLAETERLGMVLTQNIDGLHQAAGLPAGKLVELHGNGTYARCLACGARHELAAVRQRFEMQNSAPECGCGGMVKSATVAFGQALDPAATRRARMAAQDCDLFLVLGSSLVVQPAASLPLIALQHGAVMVIVNREPTRLDGAADLVIRGDVGSIFEPWSSP
jgi:NAD-dependent deacetylase